MDLIQSIKFNENGLIPAIAQDYETNEVLMLAYMDKEAVENTVRTGRAHYYSRSRKQPWLKGETSGNIQNIKEIRYDCDGDTLLLLVEQTGAACHTGHKSCFYRNAKEKVVSQKEQDEDEIYSANIIYELYKTITNRKNYPLQGSYTNYLLDKGIDKILKKVGEETAEVIIASKNRDKPEIIYEVSDLMYHLSVLLVDSGVEWQDIFRELKKRAGK